MPRRSSKTPPRARGKKAPARGTVREGAKRRTRGFRGPLAWTKAFLTSLAKYNSVTKAAKAARVNISRPYQLRKERPEFDVAWRQAKRAFSDSLREEALHQGSIGWLEPVYHGGKLVGHIRRKDSRVLLAMLKANCKEYRDRVDLSVTIRERARKLAAESGLSEAELVATAERIARGEELP